MRLYQPLLSVLERMGYGVVMIGSDNRIILLNTRAASLLLEFVIEGQAPGSGDATTRPTWQWPRELPLVDEKWVALGRRDHAKHPVVVYATPTNDQRESAPARIVVMVDLDAASAPSPSVLRDLFALTSAECRVAAAIGAGQRPTQIAKLTGVSAATIRKQLAAVFAKTRTRRQSELNALMNRLSILP
jgi:DNA-binding CsgD family transcriptional regulator